MMQHFLSALGMAVLLAVGGCGEAPGSPPTISVKIKSGTITKEAAEKAVAVFIEQCKPITGEYWGDVESATATAAAAYADYRVKAYGWTSEIEIEVKVRQDSKRIPTEQRIFGMTLHYFLGGGTRPGIIAKAQAAQAMCGLPPSPTDADVFKPVPALSILGQ